MIANIIPMPIITFTSVTPIASTHVHKGNNAKRPIPIITMPMHPIVEPFSLSLFLHMEKYAIKSPTMIKGIPIPNALEISSPSAKPTMS